MRITKKRAAIFLGGGSLRLWFVESFSYSVGRFFATFHQFGFDDDLFVVSEDKHGRFFFDRREAHHGNQVVIIFDRSSVELEDDIVYQEACVGGGSAGRDAVDAGADRNLQPDFCCGHFTEMGGRA